MRAGEELECVHTGGASGDGKPEDKERNDAFLWLGEKKRRGKKRKEKKKKENIRVLWIFYSFAYLEKLFYQTVHKNGFNSLREAAPL